MQIFILKFQTPANYNMFLRIEIWAALHNVGRNLRNQATINLLDPPKVTICSSACGPTFCHIKCEICYSYYQMFNSYHLRHLSLWVCFCWILNIQLCPQMPFNLLTITHNSTERGDKEIVTFKLLYTQNKSLTSHDMKRNYFWCLQQWNYPDNLFYTGYITMYNYSVSWR